MCAMIPVARASPITFTIVLNRSLTDTQDCEENSAFIVEMYEREREIHVSLISYRAQSTAMIRVMSSVGSPTEVNTITMVTRPACGMPAAPILAAVAVMLK